MSIKRLIQFLLVIIVVVLLTKTSYALGIGPARVDINFNPGLETSIEYTVLEENPKKELEIYAEGDLAEHVTLNKNKLVGGGSFIVTLKLPNYIEKPGRHLLFIRAKEKIDEEVVGGSVGTSVTIGAVIIINVPTPGKYLELSLGSHDVNVGEPVDFILSITSMGSEDVSISPVIDILSYEETLETLYLKDRIIKSQGAVKLKKTLDTTSYNPGRYKAIAIVDYGKIVSAESDFRIGELIINILNHTEKIIIGGIRAFEIDIESGWNNKIDGAYAQVSIFRDLEQPLVSFKTDTTGLTPWEKKTIKGHFDSSNFTKGTYDANITLIYFGKDQGRSTSEIVKVEFVEEIKAIMLVIITAGIIVLIVVILLIKRYFWRKKKRRR